MKYQNANLRGTEQKTEDFRDYKMYRMERQLHDIELRQVRLEEQFKFFSESQAKRLNMSMALFSIVAVLVAPVISSLLTVYLTK